jgi:hypothetical protein
MHQVSGSMSTKIGGPHVADRGGAGDPGRLWHDHLIARSYPKGEQTEMQSDVQDGRAIACARPVAAANSAWNARLSSDE